MKTIRNTALAALTALFAAVAPQAAMAHHSAAMFDHTKIVPINGTVKEFQWKNPHAWLIVIAPGPSGPATEFTIECSTINILARKGWTHDAFKPGDKISLTMNPTKDGAPAGFILKATTSDGHILPDHDY